MRLLSLEEQDGAVTEVEVDEVLGLCCWSDSSCYTSEAWINSIPWVTKLPKLRPTMQCHVAPFLLSNCAKVSARFQAVKRFNSPPS
jgi:hypothetical protein